MASSLNKVTLIGFVGKEPEVRTTQNDGKVATFSLATSEYWKDRATEEFKERTEWHRVVVFNARFVELIERSVKKGSRVYVEGQLQTRKWVDNQNQERQIQEVTLRYKGDLMVLDPSRRQAEDQDVSFSSGTGGFNHVHIMAESHPNNSAHSMEDAIPF